jgi:hypothetical protein
VLSAILLALSVSPALATVHPLSCSENSNAPAGTPAQTQNPPGITQPPHVDSGPDQSRAVTAQPIVAILSNSTTSDSTNAFKPPGCP